MSNSRDYLDASWREAMRAAKRSPHREMTMRSGESRGPLKLWLCDLCRATARSLTNEPPTCTGGSAHSFASN